MDELSNIKRVIKSIELRGSGDSLIEGRHFVEENLRKACISEEIIPLVVTATDEACANVVRHFYKNDPEKKYVITVKVDPVKNKIIVVVESYGEEINIKSGKRIDLAKHFEEGKESGLGIYFMHTLMDEISYHYIQKMNVVRLIKYIDEMIPVEEDPSLHYDEFKAPDTPGGSDRKPDPKDGSSS
ncbi:MAG: ATP-binding protein [Spirochaetes bacterium]|nr:ATP-binding protein [Spirochaetota bacterium]